VCFKRHKVQVRRLFLWVIFYPPFFNTFSKVTCNKLISGGEGKASFKAGGKRRGGGQIGVEPFRRK